jgi:hypothetical protein
MKVAPAAFFFGAIWISGMLILYSRQNNDSTLNSAAQAIRENNVMLQRVANALNQKYDPNSVAVQDHKSQIAIRINHNNFPKFMYRIKCKEAYHTCTRCNRNPFMVRRKLGRMGKKR